MSEATDTNSPEQKKNAPAEQPGVSDGTKSNANPMRMRFDTAEPMYRYAAVNAEDFLDENTFQIAASSEYAVQRKADKVYAALGIAKEGEKFWEVLSHRDGDVDLTRFNPPNKASFLDEHQDSRHLGPITKATLSKDNVVRVVAACDGVSQLSVTRAKQIRSGSRPNVSMGYKHTAYLGAEPQPDGRVFHRFAWEGLETSSVSVPADPSVGVFRSEKKCHCFRCGDVFERNQLNRVDGAFLCGDCEAAETPANETEEQRSLRKANAEFDQKFTRAKELSEKTVRAQKADDFRFKRDKEDEISFGVLRNSVWTAADADKRFKSKRPNGDLVSAVSVEDICYDADADTWSAILTNWYDYERWQVTFTLDDPKGGAVTLGEAQAVVQVTEYKPVAGERKADKTTRSVDSATQASAGTTAQQPLNQTKIMAENQIDEKQIRSQERELVVNEFKDTARKIEDSNKEVRALADEAVKNHGMKWNGKPGEVFVVGERIRKLESEICARGADHDAVERRRDFKRGLDEILSGARAPKVQEEAAHLDNALASRVSLRALYNGAAKAAERGQRSTCFMPTEGAELEAHQEILHRAQEFPGGLGCEVGGVLIPSNVAIARSNVTDRMARRLTRDSLAGDFPTAGALISPEYKFPIIELLRNKMALGKAGITVLGGVVGNLVLPRQTGPTTSQSVAEGAALAAYDQTFDQVKMSPHRIGSNQAYSRLAMLQSGTDFEALVYQDHIAQNALRADYLGINGSGANDEPVGILNQIGIGAVVFGGSAANAYKNVIALETAIRKANIDEEPTYITTSQVRGTLRVTPATLTGSTVVSGSTNAIWSDEEIAGRSAVDSQQVPNDILIALVGRHLVFAQWGGWQIVLDTYTQANKDKIVLSMNTYIDYALRHPQAVARSTDSLAALA